MFSVMYNFVRSRQLEGSFEDDASVGVYPITSYRVAKGWGYPPSEAWPYNGRSEDWPPMEEPIGIDKMAKENRIGVYQRVRTLCECKIVISTESPVSVVLPITSDWHDTRDGVIRIPSSTEPIIGNHMITICGYDDTKLLLKFANSWGTKWGENGYGYLPYSYFENHFIESWVIACSRLSHQNENRHGILMITYGIQDFLGGVIHAVEFYDHDKDQCVAWSFAVIRDNHLEIEELYVFPDYRFREYGAKIFDEWDRKGRELELPVRYWISHVDSDDRDNLYVIEKILSKKGLILRPSGNRWAAHCASYA